MSEGESLVADGVTPGIVRLGDTVRRPLRPFSLTVQAYLAHLRDAGFAGAPLPFGVDEQGREVLSFVPGDVPRWPLPPEIAGDDVLVALARLICTLADADIPHRVAVFADAYGMAAQQRAGQAPLAVDVVRRYHEDSRASAELDPVWRKLWEDGGSLGIPAMVYLPRAEAWVREMAPAITARLVQAS